MKYCLKTENGCLKIQTKHPLVFLTKNKKDKRFRFKFKKKRDFDFEGVVKSKAVKPNCLRRPH